MRRSGLTLTLLAIPLIVAGCSAYAYEGSVAYEVIHESPRHESRYYHRVDRDAHGYVNHLDRYLHLSRHQERRVYRLLKTRAYDLLDRTPRSAHYSVYPFPRNYGNRTHRITRRWWHETDRRIENLLSRRQIRAYRSLTHRDYYDDRYDDDDDDHYDRRHDSRHDRYDDDDDDGYDDDDE